MSGLVVALRCGNCGAALGGASTDVAWLCAPCGTAWEAEVSGGTARLVRRPCFLLEPPPGAVAASRVVWLPFWRVELEADAVSAGGGLRQRDVDAYDAVMNVVTQRVWVRAFWMRNGHNIGDPGLALTQAAFPEVRVETGPFPAAGGVAIGSAEAVRMAELFALRIADLQQDVAGLRLRTTGARFELALVPFGDLGESVVCPATGRSFRRALLEDLPPPRAPL